MTNTLDPVESASPATKLVYRTIADDAPITQKAIIEQTHLTQKTVYNAIVTLEEDLDVIEGRPKSSDLRQTLYAPKTR